MATWWVPLLWINGTSWSYSILGLYPKGLAAARAFIQSGLGHFNLGKALYVTDYWKCGVYLFFGMALSDRSIEDQHALPSSSMLLFYWCPSLTDTALTYTQLAAWWEYSDRSTYPDRAAVQVAFRNGLARLRRHIRRRCIDIGEDLQ